MLKDIWSFLLNDDNRAVLGWVGGGVVAVAGAVWAVLKFYLSERKNKSDPSPTVKATRGGVAAGRDIRNSKIDTGKGTKP